ncbi:hypothetical protein RhiirA5_401257 [Rhizophagus irregularis]|uniref:UBA domain-containing protein n=1 Tax=Rhizophagus irregularis TaxID=588596 RepID=A0A2N0PDA8_9GLOM|nr:hypothetical protein RhiirA5_401257 [Rhizophagus irregularis]
MPPAKVLKDLSVNLYFTLPPNNTQTRFTIQIKKDQLLIDVVRHFMNTDNIPCYLENSVLSTIESLMNESWRRDMERDSKIQDGSDATNIRENLIAKYKKYTTKYNDSPSENIFPKAYHTLVHSPVPSIFDTLLQLEQKYKQAIKDLVSSGEKELENVRERHQKEIEEIEPGSIQNDLIEKHHQEEVECNRATLVSGLEDIKRSQRKEYCEFVTRLYQAHQRWLTENQSATDINWIFQLDGKEIVSEVIADMKKRHKELSKQILRLVQKSGARSRHGSISSLSEVILPNLMPPTSPMFSPSGEDNNKKPAYFNEEDPHILKRMEEMGFDQEKARVALEMTNGNMEHAVNFLLDPKINNQIANTSATLTRRPSIPFVSSPLKEQTGSIGKRSKSQRKPIMTIPIKQERKNTWSTFFQQKQPLASPSSVRKIGGWLSRKSLEGDGNGLEYFYINCSIPCSIAIFGKTIEPIQINVDPFFSFQKSHGPNFQLDKPQLVESFTISLGNQVKSTHNLRLLVSDTEDLLSSSNDARDMAYRAQTAANLYSQNLTAVVLLLTPNDWPKYKLGESANKAFFKRCKESTDFHFEDVESQFDAIEKDFTTSDHTVYSVQEGDFFITRHSNLPLVHIVFHLVIEFESIQKSELTYRSNAINGLRIILKIIDRFDITSISLPILLLPSDIDIFTATDQTDENMLIKRGELVLKCTKGFMMNNVSVPKHVTEKEQETKTVTFLLNKDVSEQQFNNFRQLLTGIFRAS